MTSGAEISHNDFIKSIVFLKTEYVLILFNKALYLDYNTNKIIRTISFSDNVKNLTIFDDTVFVCSDKRALVFTNDFGIKAISSVLSGSQIIGFTVDRLFLIRSVIDSKGTQSIKVE